MRQKKSRFTDDIDERYAEIEYRGGIKVLQPWHTMVVKSQLPNSNNRLNHDLGGSWNLRVTTIDKLQRVLNAAALECVTAA